MKEKQSNAIIGKEEEIKREYERLKEVFDGLKASKMAIVDPMLQNSAFMKVCLADLQKEINKNGYSGEYMNGANQYGTKTLPELREYNSMVKNYSALQMKLIEFLKDVPTKEKSKLQLFWEEVNAGES